MWYPAYLATTAAPGLDPLEDQQMGGLEMGGLELGGLAMWLPAGLAYLVSGPAMCAHWLADSPERDATMPSVRLATFDCVIANPPFLAGEVERGSVA